MIGRLIPTLALALVVTGVDPAAAQFKPTRTVEFVVHGGPGSGNGVIGGAGALVLGVMAMALGGLALIRHRRR